MQRGNQGEGLVAADVSRDEGDDVGGEADRTEEEDESSSEPFLPKGGFFQGEGNAETFFFFFFFLRSHFPICFEDFFPLLIHFVCEFFEFEFEVRQLGEDEWLGLSFFPPLSF